MKFGKYTSLTVANNLALIAVLFCFALNATPGQKQNKDGVVYVDSVPAYVDSGKMGHLWLEALSKEKSADAKLDSIEWYTDEIVIQRFVSGKLTFQSLSYKIENEMGYFGKKKQDWRPIRVQVVESGLSCLHPKGFILRMKVRLESDYLTGNYDVLSFQGKNPKKKPKDCKFE